MISLVRYLFILTLFFISLSCNGQKRFKDAIYLHNGSIIRGKILGIDSLDRVKIQTYNEYYLVFYRSQIKRFVIKGNNEVMSDSSSKSFNERKRGYTNITQLGILSGRLKETSQKAASYYSDFSLETFNGYKLNQYISIGSIIGFDVYKDGALFPLGCSVRGNLLKGRVTPTVFANAGHSFEFFTEEEDRQDFKGGFFWSTGIGLLIKNSRNSAFTLSFLYKNQTSSLRTVNWIWENQENISFDKKSFRRFGVLLGFSF